MKLVAALATVALALLACGMLWELAIHLTGP